VALIRLWTIKEAYIKLLGKGLRINMNEVKLSVDGDQFTAEINNDKTAKICSFQLEQNWLAVAYYQ
jgi:phosphopantetheinyl transferase